MMIHDKTLSRAERQLIINRRQSRFACSLSYSCLVKTGQSINQLINQSINQSIEHSLKKATMTTPKQSESSSDRLLSRRAIFYLVLLAVQFGCQPILTRRFAPSGVNRSTIVLMQELVKFGLAFSFLLMSGAAKEAWKSKK